MPRKELKAPRDPRKVNPGTYNDVVGRTDMLGIRLLENRFEIKPEAVELDPSVWRKAVNFEVAETVVVPETGRLYGMLQFELVCRHARKRIVYLSARYLVSYHVQGACTQEDGETFVGRVGRVAAYPYFRSLVASLISEAGLQMPPLPVMSLAPRSLASAADLASIPGSADNGPK
jgi:hypothetical protein